MVRYEKAIFIVLLTFSIVAVSLSVYFAVKVLQFDIDMTKKEQVNKPEYHFVLIAQEIDNPYWRLVEKGARSAAESLHVAIEYTGPLQTDIAEHINIIEMSIASKVDGIITQGLSKNEFTPIINKAVEAGIPVITVDTDDPESKRVSYIGTDNYLAGYQAGKALVQDTGGKAAVGIVTGSFDATNQILRVKGFTDAVKSEPGIRIVAVESSNISRIQAAEKTYKILEEHPEVTAFFGTSALDGLGIAQMVERSQRNHDIYILAFDALPETLELIKKGTIAGTVVQEQFTMGHLSVEMMVDILKGNNVPALIHTDTKVVRRDNLVNMEPEQQYRGGEEK